MTVLRNETTKSLVSSGSQKSVDIVDPGFFNPNLDKIAERNFKKTKLAFPMYGVE
jgi:hypothetical protein